MEAAREVAPLIDFSTIDCALHGEAEVGAKEGLDEEAVASSCTTTVTEGLVTSGESLLPARCVARFESVVEESGASKTELNVNELPVLPVHGRAISRRSTACQPQTTITSNG